MPLAQTRLVARTHDPGDPASQITRSAGAKAVVHNAQRALNARERRRCKEKSRFFAI
jgi:hypothetical protein